MRSRHLLLSEGQACLSEALMHGIHGQRIDVCQLLLDAKADFQQARAPRCVISPCGCYPFLRGKPSNKMCLFPFSFSLKPAKTGYWALGQAAEDGSTPLILAAAGARHELCKALLAKKASSEFS